MVWYLWSNKCIVILTHSVYTVFTLYCRDGDDVEMRDNAAYGTAHQIPSTNETHYEAVNEL